MEKPFEFKVAGRDISVKAGEAVVALFRKQQDVDYLAISLDESEEVLRIFNNEDLCRWMAGFAIHETYSGDYRYKSVDVRGNTFREEFGWSPAVIVREEPNEEEQQWYAEVVTTDLEKEWEHWEDE